MQLHVSSDINAILERALNISVRQGRFYVGVEHLYGAILEHEEELPEKFRDTYHNALMALLREMNRISWTGHAQAPECDMFHTPRCINAIQQAGKLAARRGNGAAGAGHLMLAILADAHSAPSRILDANGINRGACLELLRSELEVCMTAPPAPALAAARKAQPQAKHAQPPAAQREDSTYLPEPFDKGEPQQQQPSSAAVKLESLTRDLTQMARDNKLRPAIGRDAEIFEILQVLARKTKNNVMLVGEAGVGKTQVVEGLALSISRGSAASALMPSFRVLELNLAAMMAGTQYRGAFEERLLSLLEQLKASPDTLLFIDEVHLIMGAGSTEGDGLDMANLLKPALARGEIRCVGATTLREYRKFVERDPAIERRFQMVRIEELSETATMDILEHLRPSFEDHHKVRISARALEASVQLTQRYMPNRCLPDKAIDVLDQACARFRLKMMAFQTNPDALRNTLMPTQDARVTPHDIRKVISQMTAVPIEELTAAERIHLGDMERRIKEQLIGQDEAVARAVSAVKKSRAGLADPNRPDAVMLFLGPSGVGKTQLAKLLATNLFGSSNHLITFDMSEYLEEHSVSRLLGAPPGYAGCEEEGRLSSAVRTTPFSILLFDEIEKAHRRIFDIFLPIFDEGRIKDSRGREVSFRNCVIILTSNIGADILTQSGSDDVRSELVEELRCHFRPEFINRIDDIVPFYPLLGEDLRSILRLEFVRLRERLREKHIGIRVYDGAYQFLIDKGYRPEFGARELRRVVDKEITTPISEQILKGEFGPNDMIDIMEEGGKLAFIKGRPHTSKHRPASNEE